jgi:hypothetical protein
MRCLNLRLHPKLFKVIGAARELPKFWAPFGDCDAGQSVSSLISMDAYACQIASVARPVSIWQSIEHRF